jgi:septum site-determining protein MinC
VQIKGLGELKAIVTSAVRSRQAIRLRGRSFLAFVLAPEPPIVDWLAELDSWIERSPGFFAAKPVVLDLSGVTLDKSEFTGLIADLQARAIRITGVEHADPGWLGLGLPPPMSGGRPASIIEAFEPSASPKSAGANSPSFLHDGPVRSGQSVIFPNGDVTIVGSVASGAEIVAGGSIHVYGTLRGRAIAGSSGNAQARIFCNKIEAELVAIDGLYRTAESIEANLRGRRVQVWLVGDVVMIGALE